MAASNNKPIRVLLVEDDEDDYLLTRELLAEAGEKNFKLDWAKDFDAGLDAIKACGHDAYLLDYRLGAQNGVELVSRAIAAGCKNPLILLTGASDREVAMQALAAGAADYLVKGEFDATGLERTLRYSIQKAHYAENLENEVQRRTETLRHSEEFNRSLMQGSADCLKVLDIDGRLLMMNEPGICIMEIDDPCDIEGKDWASLWPAESENTIRKAVKLARKGDVNSFQAFCPTGKGTPKWWEVTVSPIRAERNGPVVRLLSVSRDITERRAEDLRLAMFARLGEITRTADDSDALLFAISSAVRENLEAGRCFFNEIDLAGDVATVQRDSFRTGLASVAGASRLSDYSKEAVAEMLAGRTVVNADSKTDPRTAKLYKKTYAPAADRSYIAVPLMRGGRWVATFWVSDDKPRVWHPVDVRLVEAVGERAWLAVEKLRNEAALRDSEERFSRFMHHLPGLAWIKDTEGRYVFANEAAAAAFRTPVERLYGKTDDEVFPPDIAARFKENDEKAVADGVGVQTVETLEHEDGIHHSIVNKFPIAGPNGEISLVGGMAIDITERMRAEEAASHLAAIVTSSEDAIVSKDLSGVIMSWNAGAEHLFGYTAEEAVGQPVTMLIPDDHLDEEPRILERVRNGDVIEHYETVRRRKDGTLIDISLTVSPMRDASGNIIGASKIARDITYRRQAEEDLRRYREELESLVVDRTSDLDRAHKILDQENTQRLRVEKEAVRLLKQIVTIQEDERRRIARDLHDDLGQKLTALRLKLENAKKICDDELVCDEIDAIQALAESLDADIGFLARELRPPALDDTALSGALEKFVRDWSRFAGVSAEFRVSGLDAQRLDPEVETNLYRIVQEALNNAHKYAKAKNVSVLLARRKYDVSLIIEDDGVGFKHGGKAKGNGNGKTGGLGILGMRERTALLGGDLNIESSPGAGTTIFVNVPIGS